MNMQKMAVFTLVGIASGGTGIYLGYLFILSLNKNPNFIFLIASLILVLAGAFCLFKATNPKIKDETASVDQALEKTAGLIAKNNTTLNEWNKTNETKDRLKMLKMASAAAEQAKKEQQAS